MAPPTELDATLPKKQDTADQHSSTDYARELSQTIAKTMRTGGDYLADSLSIDHHIDPEVRRMLRDFGLTAQHVADALEPPPPQPPGSNRNACDGVTAHRARMKAAGVDPDDTKGIVITVFDSFALTENHGLYVTSLIGFDNRGLIHGAQTKDVEFAGQRKKYFEDMVRKPAENSLDKIIPEMILDTIEHATKLLESTCIDHHDPNMRVVNMSLGVEPVKLTDGIFTQMYENRERYKPWLDKLVGKETADKWLAAGRFVFPPPEMPEDKLIFNALFKEIDKYFTADPRIDAAMTAYRDVTRRAAERGITIVVAASNSQSKLPDQDSLLRPGIGFNLLAQSDYVIAVGACNLNNTPERNSDDYVTSFSSHGNQRYHPTVLAQGEGVSSHFGGISGTSFATPLVSATVALMLAQNPDLKFDQIKALLQENSSRLYHAGVEAQGAGELNIAEAVLAARDSRKK